MTDANFREGSTPAFTEPGSSHKYSALDQNDTILFAIAKVEVLQKAVVDGYAIGHPQWTHNLLGEIGALIEREAELRRK